MVKHTQTIHHFVGLALKVLRLLQRKMLVASFEESFEIISVAQGGNYAASNIFTNPYFLNIFGLVPNIYNLGSFKNYVTQNS